MNDEAFDAGRGSFLTREGKVQLDALLMNGENLRTGGVEQADAHAPGTMENLIVVRGELEIRTHSGQYLLRAGDAFLFQADEAHEYRNLANEDALIYLVMTYQESALER